MTTNADNELPISDGNGALIPEAWLAVLAIMSFPRDDDKALALIDAVAGDAILKGAEESPKARARLGSALSQPGELFGMLRAAGRAPALIAEAEQAQQRGMTAGQVLGTVMRASPFPALASVNKAVRLVMQTQNRGRSAIMADWEEFKSVAHLYLARGIFRLLAAREIHELALEAASSAPGAMSQDKALAQAFRAIRADDEVMDAFSESNESNTIIILSLSEKIRRAAEAHTSLGSVQPLFEDDCAIRVPSDISISDVPWIMPKLTDDDLKNLAGRGDARGKRRS